MKLWWQLVRSTSCPAPDEREERHQSVVHHRRTIGHGVVLGPQHVSDVGLELRRALQEVSQVRVFELERLLLGLRPGQLDVALRKLVADATAAGVQHDPHRVALVEANLEEVVSRPEGSELRRCLHLLLLRSARPGPCWPASSRPPSVTSDRDPVPYQRE